MAVRQIVILKRTDTPTGSIYAYLLRADVPAARQSQFAKPTYISPYVPIPPDTDPDAAALLSGAVVETSATTTVTPAVTIASIQAQLRTAQATYQAQVTADPTFSRYGTYWNGTAWIAQGV